MLLYVVLDVSGEAIWVQTSREVAESLGFDPTASVNFAKRVLVIGSVQTQARPVFLVSDFVRRLQPDEFVGADGIVSDYAASAQSFALTMKDGTRFDVALIETT